MLLVDDHALVRRGFRLILEDEADLKVVGEAGEGSEAVEMAQRLKPDVVVMDYSLPGANGLVAVGQIVKSCPGTAVLMLSMHSEEATITFGPPSLLVSASRKVSRIQPTS